VVAQPSQVSLVVGGVGHRQEAILRQAVREEVIEHAAVLATHYAVLCPALGDAPDVVGQHSLQQTLGVRSPSLDLAHVGDIEHSHAAPYSNVLLANAPVLDWHLEPGKRHHARAGGHMPVVQRRRAH
jgi:hypothetical protein